MLDYFTALSIFTRDKIHKQKLEVIWYQGQGWPNKMKNYNHFKKREKLQHKQWSIEMKPKDQKTATIVRDGRTIIKRLKFFNHRFLLNFSLFLFEYIFILNKLQMYHLLFTCGVCVSRNIRCSFVVPLLNKSSSALLASKSNLVCWGND